MGGVLFRILVMILLLYPIVLGFYFGQNKPKKKDKIIYATLSILLALTNIIVAMASYVGGFINDSWFNFIFFYALQIAILIAFILHIIMLVKKHYNNKLMMIFAIIIFVLGLGFTISLMIFSNTDRLFEEGLTFTNALLTIIPTLFATTLFTLFSSDKKTFYFKRTI